MTKILWTSSFETGNHEVDDYHREIMDLINLLEEAIIAQSSNRAIKNIVKSIYKYSIDHFNYEEMSLKMNRYDELPQIKKSHKESLKNLHAIIDKSSSMEKVEDYFECYDSIYNWFFNHIIQEDQRYLSSVEKDRDASSAA